MARYFRFPPAGGGGGSATDVNISDASGNALDSDGAGALKVAVVSGGGSNASVGTIGAAVPASATTVGVQDGSGNLRAPLLGSQTMVNSLSVAIASNQTAVPISAASLPLPTGAATAAKQPALGTAGSPSTDVISIQGVASGTVIPVSAASLPLPTGAATETTLAAASAKLPATLGQKAMAASLAVALASDQSAIPVSQSGTWNITNVSGTVSLPTGASTAANQATEIASLSSIDGKLGSLGQKAMAGSAPVVIASDQSSIPAKLAGKAAIGKARNDYTSVNVTTAAYVQLIASTALAATEMFIFDSSGQTLVLAFGAAASEVDQFYIVPGGNATVPITVPISTRVSIKAVSATASAGEIDINLFG